MMGRATGHAEDSWCNKIARKSLVIVGIPKNHSTYCDFKWNCGY
jgi:hypothetical protein